MRSLLIALITLSASIVVAQTQTVGVFVHDSLRAYQGYTLFSPVTSQKTYLIDNDGQVVNEWSSLYPPGQAFMLLNDGNLLRTGLPFVPEMGGGGAGGIVEKFTWSGELLWRYSHFSTTFRAHHDVEILPNGNILLLVWESHTRQEAFARGRDQTRLIENSLWSERIIEVKQTGEETGEIVWSWSTWDNMIQDRDPQKPDYGLPADNPFRIDINSGDNRADWLHFNSVRYNPLRDEVLISCRNLSEIMIVSRKTNSIVYRWGNPASYKSAGGTRQSLYVQHDARWIDSAYTKLLVFNNGQNRVGVTPKDYSTVEEFTPPLAEDGTYIKEPGVRFGPETYDWIYPETPNSDFLAFNISGATRQPNGNTLICVGPFGTLTEVTRSGHEVWRYVNPVGNSGAVRQGETPSNNMIFKVYRYGPTHPALAGKTLRPRGKLEDGPLSVAQSIFPAGLRVDLDIFNHRAVIHVAESSYLRLFAYDLTGRRLGLVVDSELGAGTHVIQVPSGTYLVR